MSFTRIQTGVLSSTPPTIALTMPAVSRPGSLLIATISANDATLGPVTPPPPRPVIMGATIGKSNYSGQSEGQAIGTFDNLVGRPMAINVQKVYHQEGSAASGFPQADMKAQIAAGAWILLSAKPCRTAGNTYADGTVCTNGKTCLQEKNNLTALLKNFLALGLTTSSFKVTLWQEPNSTSGFDTSGHYQNYLTYYAPAVRALGLPVCYNPLIGFGGNWDEVTGYPGDALVDELYADYYGTAYGVSSGTPVNTLDGTGSGDSGSFVALADNHSGGPIPFGIAEFNASAGGATIGTAQWNAYMGYLQGLLASRMAAGKPMGWVICWMGDNAAPANGGNGQDQILTSSDFKIPALQAMYDALCAGGTVPANHSGWQLAATESASGGFVSQFYYAGNPGGLYGPNNPAVFTWGSGSVPRLRCSLSEMSPPAGTGQVILDAVGSNSGSGYATSTSLSTAGGSFGGSAAVLSEAHFFAAGMPPSGTSFTVPSGYVQDGTRAVNVAGVFQQCSNASINPPGAAGVQTAAGGFSYTGPIASNGWAAVLCCYRATAVAPINWVGHEVTNTLDIDPTSQSLILGGDVEGFFRTANLGDNWQPSDYGIEDANRQCFAFVNWSQMGGSEAGNIYAGGGHGAGNGAFLVSTDGGCTWAQRSTTTIWWYGNASPSPPRPSANAPDEDRGVGRILAQDPAGGYLYTVSGNIDVARSADFGATWTQISKGIGPTASFYPRCLALNPANPQELWVGAWDTGNGLGGVWHTANARTASPSWSQLGGYTGTVSEMKVIGGYLYISACSGTRGVYRVQAGSSTLAALNGGVIDTTATTLWTSLDGYVDGSGNHVIVVAGAPGVKKAGNLNNTQLVRLTLPGGSSTGITYADLTNSVPGTQTINSVTTPPFAQPWWSAGASWKTWLGGTAVGNRHVLIDPNNTSHIFVTGSGGFFRSLDGGQTWQMAVNGLTLSKINVAATDPRDGTHFITGGGDFTQMDFLDPTGNNWAINGIPGPVAGANPPGNGFESHAIAFDPVSSLVYMGQNVKFSQDTGGAVYTRPAAAPFTWSPELGYSAAGVANGHAPMGMVAGRDQNNNRFLVVLANSAGMFRYSAAGSGGWAKCAENDTAPLPGTGGTLGGRTPFVPFVTGNSPSHLWVWDPPNGLYRSVDYGVSWTQIWTQGGANQMAFNPKVDQELWAAGTTNLWRISGAGNGVVGSAGGPTVTAMGGVFSAGCGGVAFAPNGALYAVAEGGNAPAPPVTTLYVSYTGGTSWVPAGDSGDASYGAPAGALYISRSGWLWQTAGTHVGYWDQVVTTGTGTASLAGTGTLTAVSQATHGAALAGTGTLTANGFPSSRTATLTATGTATALATFGATRQLTAALSGSGFLDAEQAIITSNSIVPQYQAGQLILASDANNWFTWDIAFKAQDLGRTASALSPDPELSLRVAAGGSYEVRLVAAWDGPTSTGFLYNWAYPSDATMFMTRWRWASGSLGEKSDAGNSNRSADTNAGSQREVLQAYGNYQGGQDDGTLVFQWAPNQDSSSPVSLLAGSFMMIRRIS